MNMSAVLLPAFIAFTFVVWPIVGKYSGVVGPWVGVLSSVGTLSVVATLSGRTLATPLTVREFALLLAAGAINGVGVYFYSLRTAAPTGTTSTFIVMTCIMMVVWAPILDRILNGAAFNLRHAAGFAAAAAAIYLLRQ